MVNVLAVTCKFDPVVAELSVIDRQVWFVLAVTVNPAIMTSSPAVGTPKSQVATEFQFPDAFAQNTMPLYSWFFIVFLGNSWFVD